MGLSRGESDAKGGSRGRQGQITEGLVGLGKKIYILFSRSEVSKLFVSKAI